MRTFLKVLSVLLIIGAAISIVLGVVTIGGGGVIAGLGGYGNMGLTADESFGAALVGGLAVVMGIFLILSAAFNLIAVAHGSSPLSFQYAECFLSINSGRGQCDHNWKFLNEKKATRLANAKRESTI